MVGAIKGNDHYGNSLAHFQTFLFNTFLGHPFIIFMKRRMQIMYETQF